MTTFKPLEKVDISTITQMMQDFYAIDNYPMDVEESKKLFQEFITNENLGKSWLIFSENEIVGYIILTFIFSFEYSGKIAFIDELFIKETARGKGFGKQLMQEAISIAEGNIALHVEPDNPAKKLYESLGFTNKYLEMRLIK